MKKVSVILSSLLFLLTLTTFKPNHLNSGLNIFKIKNIEIKNLETLNKKIIKRSFYNELVGSSLFVLDNEKINSVINKYELIDYIKLKKIYPSKLQIIIYEKQAIAILNKKKRKYYLTKKGEKINFFKNQELEKLPNIFGKQENFTDIYLALVQLDFPITKIKSFYYFEIGRWDIILKDNKVIKLPAKNFVNSLRNYTELEKKNNFEKYSIFDYRIKDQLILN